MQKEIEKARSKEKYLSETSSNPYSVTFPLNVYAGILTFDYFLLFFSVISL